MADNSSETVPATPEEQWSFPGWGRSERIDDLGDDPVPVTSLTGHAKHQLGTWKATAICGNDITSSCLYVSALAGIAAGPYAPLALIIVAGLLFLFRKIYGEVGSALPLNGGTYTLLLNSTNKKLAAGAACLTLLSYLATAVISAGEGMHYASDLISINVFVATIGLLGFFALLNLVGISESAGVALAIFVFHITTLTVLCVASVISILGDPSTFTANWHVPPPGGMIHALFFGFAAAMLGISGFESSANFIEEQKKGVFPKTLRNMWIAVAVFNPLISLLSMGMVPLDQFHANKDNLLSLMGRTSGGPWLGTWVSIDAVLVLSGAVLTSYVGVTGLVRRMSLDRCLPQLLLRENKWRKTNHWIILSFFALCTSIMFITQGDVEILAGVYTLSFLAVMSLFATGNMLLKVVRSRLPREIRAGWPAVVVALIGVLAGLVGNITLENLRIFGIFFGAVAGAVMLMFVRTYLLRLLLFVSRGVVEWVTSINDAIRRSVIGKLRQITDRSTVYFTRGDDLATLNRAALYVLKNEQTQQMKVVHVFEDEKDIPKQLSEHLQMVNRMYPQLKIDFLAVKGEFGPELIERLSRRLRVPKNYMFIGTPGDHFPHRIEHLGGVRLIL